VPPTCTSAEENILSQQRDVSNEEFEKMTGRIFQFQNLYTVLNIVGVINGGQEGWFM